MKRKLPSLSDTTRYLGPDDAHKQIAALGDTYTLWAYTMTPSDPNSINTDAPDGEPVMVRLARVGTHEVPGSKWVEFTVLPEAVLISGGFLYASDKLAGMLVMCDWSDFLRLTRWRKQVAHLSPDLQALIARCSVSTHERGMAILRLTAVDDPIRHLSSSV